MNNAYFRMRNRKRMAWPRAQEGLETKTTTVTSGSKRNTFYILLGSKFPILQLALHSMCLEESVKVLTELYSTHCEQPQPLTAPREWDTSDLLRPLHTSKRPMYRKDRWMTGRKGKGRSILPYLFKPGEKRSALCSLLAFGHYSVTI